MKPFKRGFVEKCAEYGIEKEAAKNLFDKMSGFWNSPGMIGTLLGGATGGLVNYAKHGQGARAGLAGLGTGLGVGLGMPIGASIGGVGSGALSGEIGKIKPGDHVDPSTLLDMPWTLGGAIAGGAAGSGVGGYAGYQLGDWLGKPNEPEKKEQPQ